MSAECKLMVLQCLPRFTYDASKIELQITAH
jgi:hypothetical protein